jgi:hypothetical protein
MRLNFSGRDFTACMVNLLTERSHKFSAASKKEIVRVVKEKLCFVEIEFDAKAASPSVIEAIMSFPIATSSQLRL